MEGGSYRTKTVSPRGYFDPWFFPGGFGQMPRQRLEMSFEKALGPRNVAPLLPEDYRLRDFKEILRIRSRMDPGWCAVR